MKKKDKLLDILKKTTPNLRLPEGKNTMVLCDKWLTNVPLDWVEFVMWTVKTQTETVNHLICLDDDETLFALDVLAKKEFHAFVVPFKPDVDKPIHIWEILCVPNDKEERWYYGGENLRKFCDSKNLYYRSVLNDAGELLSATQCIYEKHDGEDCRVPFNDLPNGGSSIEAITEPA